MTKLDKILTIRYNNVKPAAGRLLVAEPFMVDFYFRRSVVLLADHNEEGTFGLILNKPVSVRFDEVLKGFSGFKGDIFMGGPVQNENVFYLHTLGQRIAGSMQIMDGLWWGGESEALRRMILNGEVDPKDVRFFLGYSGWAGNQLDEELKRHSWIVTAAPASFLLDTQPGLLWKETLQRLGGHYHYWTRFPNDPQSN